MVTFNFYGIPSKCINYDWYTADGGCEVSADESAYTLWCSNNALLDPNGTVPGFSWIEGISQIDTNFVSVVFEAQKDDGILGEKLFSPYEMKIRYY